MPLQSVYSNGGFIGQTLSFSSTETLPETITHTYNGVFHQNAPGSTSMTISNVSTGNITANDWLVIAVCIEMSRATYTNGWVNSLTVDGSPATIIAQSPVNENLTTTQTHTVIGYITGITSSTVSVVVGYNDGGSQFRGSVASYKLVSSGTIEVLNSDYSYTNTSGTKTLTTDVQDNGVVIYQVMLADETSTDTWSGLTTENYNIAHPENNASLSGGIYIPTSTGSYSASVTIGGSATNENSVVAASFKSNQAGIQYASGIWNLQSVLETLAKTDLEVLQSSDNFFNLVGDPLNIHGWSSTAGNNACTQTRDTSVTDSPYGGVPVRMDITGNDPHFGTYNGSQWNIAPAANGETWEVSVLAKASVATNGQIFIFGANSSGNWSTGGISGDPLSITALAINIGTEWQEFSHTITMDRSEVAYIQIRLDGTQSGGSGISIWYDGLQVYRVS